MTFTRILAACTATGPRPQQRLLRHREDVLALLRRSGASQVLVFGSVARGEDAAASDIDLLVDHLDPGSYSWGVPKVKAELETLLGVAVDVGEIGKLRPRVRAEALRDAQPL